MRAERAARAAADSGFPPAPEPPALEPPAGTPARCGDLAARGLQGWAITELALEDDGGAVSAHEIEARRAALQPLERASRRALVAACSPEVWPDR